MLTDNLLQIALGLLASALSAGFGWAARQAVARRARRRMQDFFGLRPDTEALLVVPRHMSGRENSVHRDDVLALTALAVLARECGGRVVLQAHDAVRRGLGDKTEFCVGGPVANARSAAHLRWRLPGLRVEEEPDRPTAPGVFRIGERTYRRGPDAAYVVLARLASPDDGTGAPGHPVFLVCGQTAVTNQAGAQYLARHHRELARSVRRGRGRGDADLCLLLRVVDTASYGPDVVELVADVTREALAPVAAPAGATPDEATVPPRDAALPAGAQTGDEGLRDEEPGNQEPGHEEGDAAGAVTGR
ncbi:hypothetical protein [Allostreptomyces psammosilenae]|uniref:Secreted protein n=1 Tax=Allostreptomyces psammosilenae TaxID=1892865 RepID=A0A852ZY40_9ACTN|nr:hypothetical protein [Allostreptomyces psammosilenae]NYI07293.1 hypothetical protein [Allostreptomyces psammosilenae]